MEQPPGPSVQTQLDCGAEAATEFEHEDDPEPGLVEHKPARNHGLTRLEPATDH